MKEFLDRISGERLLQIVLVCAITFLAYNNIDGWGWLTFALLLTL